ncbi:Ldh family oxidoreductase [Marinobacterium lutimaris]|uniref:Malate/lactate/ureidoglycolate dehydrogenase, LDH2 family n=1 Tax=Marinobacterium lutimaris TaxID=568106 RepID=A0A1H6DUG1_9GAMM|nr:Ldh family oxidoreductase [Marinobacterium lutimaris]SEG88879.1 Malate/lactate/ureidoglycolate dehydrogenase, LDH2 family [Marinobacterium lutimaris]
MQYDMKLTLSEVHSLAKRLLLAQGFNERHANAIANTVTAAERDECRHHGLFRIPFYVNAFRAGQASGDAEPTVTKLAPSIIKVDAHHGFSPLALEVADLPLAELAKETGIAAVAINNALSVSALWPEVERLAEKGLVGFAFVAASPYVAPAGGTKPLYGTNPMAFSWPREGHEPLVFDQASSASARGEIQVRLRDGRQLEEGWAVGPDGKPTLDPATALAGAQLPFGGVKGAAIAMMVELLAGPLVGDLLSFEAGEKDVANTGAPCGGELIIAIDPVRCIENGNRAAQLAHGEMLFSKILEQEGTRLPSDRRYQARKRTAVEGVSVPKVLYEQLQEFSTGEFSGKRFAYEGDDLIKGTAEQKG